MSDKTRILYISYDGMTDPLGQSQVLPYLTGLAAKGYEISLISAEKKEREEVKPIIESICNTAGIKWYPLFYTKKPPVLSTIYDVWSIRKLAERLHKHDPFQIIHCRSYISALIGLGMKKNFNTKFIFDMRGFWADERVDGGLWNLKSPVYRTVYNYFKKKEKQFLLSADYSISLTEKGKEVIESELVKKKLNIEVIPCCADTGHFSESSVSQSRKQELRSQLSISESEKVLGYVGSLGTWYLLEEMLVFYKMLLKKDSLYKFLIITLDEAEKVYSLADKLKIDREKIRVVPSSRKDLPNYISLMNLSVFFIKPAFSKQASSPTKQGELMAMGVPVIANSGVGDSDFIIQKYHSGKVVDVSNLNEMESIVSTIDSVEGLDRATIKLGANEFFSLEKGIEKYHSVYKAVLGRK